MQPIAITDKDISTLNARGITEKNILEQIRLFEQGASFRDILRPCIPGDGIKRLSEAEKNDYLTLYNEKSKHLQPVKFVPASGAATRMFKDLLAFLDDSAKSPDQDINTFIQYIEAFAFKKTLAGIIAKNGESLEKLIEMKDYRAVFSYLLTPKGLNYANLPKGLLEFHAYGKETRTPFEEHLVEAGIYARGKSKAILHFTVSTDHLDGFRKKFEETRRRYEKILGVDLDVSFSIQASDTDTISVDENNKPFRTKNGSLLLRPGGHGALIGNLNRMQKDIVFIKNIDNVAPDVIKKPNSTWKKALGGYLFHIQDKLFGYIEAIEEMKRNGRADESVLDDALGFLETHLCIKPEKRMSTDIKSDYLLEKLNRPLRVCGMVINRKEPGGGPFWVKDEKGEISLQIVETAEIDTNDENYRTILKKSTHFNPVDIVLSFKNYKGEYFDLKNYINPSTFFITHKSSEGKPLKALEHPGLWNGAMWHWNTVFIEVPEETFNPVKTVFDLLRDSHIEHTDL